MASFQNFVFKILLKQGIKKAQKSVEGRESVNIEETRNGMAKLFSISKIPSGVLFEKIECDGLPAEWVIPNNLKNSGIVLYLHGGGYLMGSIKTHKPLMGRIALASKTKIFAIEYRLAPENPFPCALDDSIKAYHWLLKQGHDPKKIVIAGDSAGGGLAVATLIRLKDENAPLPAACVCLSPWLDLENTGNTIITNAKKDMLINATGLKIAAPIYAPDKNFSHPYVSPLYADLKGLPPFYIQVSSSEALLDDTLRFEKKAKANGVEVEVQVWKDMVHVWQAFGFLPEAMKAIKNIGVYIEKKTR